MTNYTKFMFFMITALIANQVVAQVKGVEYDWNIKKDQDGIAIYTSKVPGSKYHAFKSVMLVSGTASSLVSLVQDTSTCSQWVDLCTEARIHSRISETDYYVYSYNDIPFPASDRDVIARTVWTQNPDSLKITMSTYPEPDLIPRTNAVRIQEAFSQWHFTARDDGKTLVENFGHINPNGPAPAWLTNHLLVSSPFKTLKAMRTMIESGAYKNEQVAFIKEIAKNK
jgi:hypothetical protein